MVLFIPKSLAMVKERKRQHIPRCRRAIPQATRRNQTSWQKRIWEEVYMDGLAHFAAIVQDAPITVVDGGDLVQGVYHIDDVVSTRLKDQFEISLLTFAPIYKLFPNVIQTILLIGTRAHALDEEGTVEIVMRDRLRAGGHYTEVKGHGLETIGGVTVDLSHIGAMAGRGYMRGNSLINYLKGNMIEEILIGGQIPANLYIRFHYHDFITEQWSMRVGEELITSIGVVCPPLCSMNGYARGATRSQPYQTIGMVLVRIEGDRIDIIPWIKTFDIREYTGEKRGVVFFKWKGQLNPN